MKKSFLKTILFLLICTNFLVLNAQIEIRDSMFAYLRNKGDLVREEERIDSLYRYNSFMVDTIVFCESTSVAIFRFGALSAHTTVNFMIVRDDSISVLSEPFLGQMPEIVKLFETCEDCFTRIAILKVLNALIREEMMNDKIRAHNNWNLRIKPIN